MNSMKLKLFLLAPAVGLALCAGGALAHHSFSMFDPVKTDTLRGTVKSLDVVNPHSWLNIMVGGRTEWALEMGGPGQLQAQGWTTAGIKPGDSITVRIHPLRDGSNGGQLLSATLASGRTLSAQPPGRGGGE